MLVAVVGSTYHCYWFGTVSARMRLLALLTHSISGHAQSVHDDLQAGGQSLLLPLLVRLNRAKQ